MVTGTENPRCPLCKETFADQVQFEAHRGSSAHRVKWLMHWYDSKRYLLASNKNGVEVHPAGDEDIFEYNEVEGKVSIITQPGVPQTIDLIIKNAGDSSSPVVVRLIESLHSSKSITMNDEYDVTKNKRFVRIMPGLEYSVQCKVIGGEEGVESVPFAMQFMAEKEGALFYIVRTIEMISIDDVAKEAGPSSEFQVAGTPVLMSTARELNGFYAGVPIDKDFDARGQSMPSQNKLEFFDLNPEIKRIASNDFNPTKVGRLSLKAKRLRKMMNAGLNPNNYTDWFQTMLWAEEMQMKKDIQYYNMKDVRLKEVPRANYSGNIEFVELQVLGLAEKRPSVLQGDSVYVSFYGTRRPFYEGVVHKVNDRSLYLAFGGEFMSKFIDNTRVNVEFTFNRYSLRVSHRAVVLTKELTLQHLTFPKEPKGPLPPKPPILPYNRKIESNKQQLEAIANIVAGSSKPYPYIIFGPPGTGKTVTVVEAIKQVYKLYPSSVILTAAPSNSAVDLLTKRLLEHIPKACMFRMHARSRAVNTIPQELLEISNVRGSEVYIPHDDQFSQYRIIACTFISASKIASACLPSGHITHVFLDECGHAMEPECLAALSGIVHDEKSQVVLAGDPHQLGPIVRNTQCFSRGNFFSNNGLDKSFLERLMGEKMYLPKNGQYNTRVVTKLLNNYRSHPSILKTPNELFYNNELQPCADRVLVSSLCNWEHLKTRNFPMIFHGVRGKDEREGNSPSYFNAIEVSQVIKYVRLLLDTRSPKIPPKEIGIVTPYRRQVEKIRSQLSRVHRSSEIKVGSPEEFQGDERTIIIISCVRASSDQLALDQMFKLGFLRNPKRFNVAITRAKALLIVIGCPDILQLDVHWRNLLEYIREKGGYTGTPMVKDSLDLDDVLSRFDSLSLHPTEDEEIGIREIAEAPEWRVEN